MNMASRVSRISRIKRLLTRRTKTSRTPATVTATNRVSTTTTPRAIQSQPSTIAKLATTVTSKKDVDTKETDPIWTPQPTSYLDQPLDEVTDDTPNFHDNGAPVLNKDFLQRISDE
jgi:hypothetical protein